MDSKTTDTPGDDDKSALIPATPSADDYAEEAKAQEAFGAEADQGDVFGDGADPLALFRDWLALAGQHEINDPNAMTLATVDRDGVPDARIVLLKDVGEAFTFYTNMGSAKGEQLSGQPDCALLFHWKSIRRQVRVRGRAEPVPAAEADAYFATRDRGSQIGAWASQQSREMDEAGILHHRIADYEDLFDGKDVQRPSFWRGYNVVPETVEFWVNRPFRLHDRRLFVRSGDAWTCSTLYP
ncbi:MAG: pyridoxamine 5'-phosphate oxidase [Pseudomonadota bacterium]